MLPSPRIVLTDKCHRLKGLQLFQQTVDGLAGVNVGCTMLSWPTCFLPPATDPQPFKGLRVLYLEDEAVVAMR